ncbi:esterase-like activity of phytase family protein [Qipengyuania soli]|uniref:Esterase-like activity of phytase family protein n=1 Tax=Qipengyuania soli TaxID=2782568 RepID=A0A7S8F416_9SPHN|nr:esterase-like activity of phytase family protein [Qipengyuania soli]QPC98756.1 esterase-like activity of phytase family protein [Qipengyuania soli]
MVRRARLLLGLLVAGTLGAATWLRSDLPAADPKPAIRFARLISTPAKVGPFTLEKAWQLINPKKNFGGYSALVALPDGTLRAGSDGGSSLDFQQPDIDPGNGRVRWMAKAEMADKQSVDLEALTSDADGRTIWGAYEMSNSIVRFTTDMERRGEIRPAAMADWGSNSGPEAFTRLADGRFLAIEERELEWDGARHRAVLFDGDPVAGGKARKLTFVGIAGYRPVDLVAVGGGRALVLFRDLVFGLPPRFRTAIGIIDLDSAKDGGDIRTSVLARFDGRIPQDNYEGMALTRDSQGTHVWLISDDNLMQYQRTLLLKLRWNEGRERQKARE